MVACRENQSEIAAYLQLAMDIGVNEARIIPLKRLGNAMNGGPTPAPQLQILQTIAAALDRNPSLEGLCQTDLYAIIKSMVRESSRRKTCGSGTQTLLLQANGSVYPCINSTLPQARLGRLGGSTETVLHKGAEWGEVLSVERAEHPCYPCAVKRWCLAGCPGESLQRDGALRSPHWNCADLKESIVFMMWESTRLQNKSAVARTRI
jgi:radical SAM protein with 4Fe4S-binding SPASM domain